MSEKTGKILKTLEPHRSFYENSLKKIREEKERKAQENDSTISSSGTLTKRKERTDEELINDPRAWYSLMRNAITNSINSSNSFKTRPRRILKTHLLITIITRA